VHVRSGQPGAGLQPPGLQHTLRLGTEHVDHGLAARRHATAARRDAAATTAALAVAPGPRALTPLELLLAKIALSAAIVIGVTLAAEHLGPRLGGLIAATPQLSVLTVVFFTLEQGREFATETAFWTIPGMCATIPVYFAYLVAADRIKGPRLASIATGVIAAFAAFAIAIALIGLLPLTRLTALPFAALVCFVAARLVRRLPDTAPLARIRPSTGLLLARASVSAAMVIGITAAAHALGPKWSGLVAGFPANSLPVLTILHFHYGPRTIEPMVKLWPPGAFGICLFNLAASLTLPRLGLLGSLIVSYVVDLAYLVALNWRWLVRTRARL